MKAGNCWLSHLKFSIFDDERCGQSARESDTSNPFSAAQLVLVTLDFITQNRTWYQALIEEKWDLMVVDEAHHLQWQQDNASIEYLCLEHLAQTISGVLLLTATPDQLGHESHFARLRLLGPDRFFDYQQFIEEEAHYVEVADAANVLVAGDNLTKNQQEKLIALLTNSDISALLKGIKMLTRVSNRLTII